MQSFMSASEAPQGGASDPVQGGVVVLEELLDDDDDDEGDPDTDAGGAGESGNDQVLLSHGVSGATTRGPTP